MKPIRAFQILVIARTLFSILWQFLPWIWWPADPLVHKLMGFNGSFKLLGQGHRDIYYDIQIVLLWCGVFAGVGMYFFQQWGRYLFLGNIVIIWLGLLVSGMVILDPPYAFGFMTFILLDGAILALAFLSPLATAFASGSNIAIERDASPQSGSHPLP